MLPGSRGLDSRLPTPPGFSRALGGFSRCGTSGSSSARPCGRRTHVRSGEPAAVDRTICREPERRLRTLRSGCPRSGGSRRQPMDSKGWADVEGVTRRSDGHLRLRTGSRLRLRLLRSLGRLRWTCPASSRGYCGTPPHAPTCSLAGSLTGCLASSSFAAKRPSRMQSGIPIPS